MVDDIGLLADGQITMGPTKGKIWYVYTDNKGKQYKLQPDEVLHFKGLSFDGIVGLSPLERLRGTIENAGYASSFLNKSFKQGLQAAGIVHYVGDLSPEAQKALPREIRGNVGWSEKRQQSSAAAHWLSVSAVGDEAH